MLHVVLALAPLLSVGTQAPQGGGRFQTMTVLHEFKHYLEHGQPPNTPPASPDVPPTLDGGTAVNYCTATPHSFGGPASITWSGSLNLANANFGLKMNSLPPVSASFGMVTFGKVQTFFPFANGFLCISPFTVPGDPQSGLFHFNMQPLTSSGIVDNSMLTTPAEYGFFTPSSTWNFQFWYRNPQAFNQGAPSTVNLTNGLKITFAPPGN